MEEGREKGKQRDSNSPKNFLFLSTQKKKERKEKKKGNRTGKFNLLTAR